MRLACLTKILQLEQEQNKFGETDQELSRGHIFPSNFRIKEQALRYLQKSEFILRITLASA
jgi:hypothetical protein